jgi:hypothetical protein
MKRRRRIEMADAMARLELQAVSGEAEGPPTHELADRLIALDDFGRAGDSARRDSVAAEYERLSALLSRRIGPGHAFCRGGRVLIPIARAGPPHVLILPARDLDREALDHFERSVISAAGRAIAGHQLAGDRRSLVDAFLLCTDCSGSQAAELVDALAGLDRLPPPDMAGLRHLAEELLERRLARDWRPEPPSEGDPVAYRFPFEDPSPDDPKEN